MQQSLEKLLSYLISLKREGQEDDDEKKSIIDDTTRCLEPCVTRCRLCLVTLLLLRLFLSTSTRVVVVPIILSWCSRLPPLFFSHQIRLLIIGLISQREFIHFYQGNDNYARDYSVWYTTAIGAVSSRLSFTLSLSG